MVQPGEPLLGISFHKMDGSELNLFSNTKNFLKKEDTQTDRVLFEWVSEEKIRIVREYWRDENSSYVLKS